MGMGFASRGDFARDMGIKMLSEDTNVDIMYFVGCYASLTKETRRLPNIL